jgi:hypothetical protein
MAVTVFTDGFITIGGTNLSSRCTSITVDDGYADVDLKAFSNTAENAGIGLRKQSIKATFLQDFAASSTHATLQAALGVSTAVLVRPTSAVNSATNPQWTASLMLTDYNPVGAKVGDKYEVSVEFKTQGSTLTYS